MINKIASSQEWNNIQMYERESERMGDCGVWSVFLKYSRFFLETKRKGYKILTQNFILFSISFVPSSLRSLLNTFLSFNFVLSRHSLFHNIFYVFFFSFNSPTHEYKVFIFAVQ
jgi:hypothetical protein